MRDNFEKESKRSREELNKQMERLRSNMSSMLQQGDQESKVLEMQNSLLFNDLKLAQTECEALKFTKSQNEDHLNHLRKELEITQQDTRTALIESRELRQAVAKSQQTTQSLQLELTKVKAQLNVSEIEYERIRNNSSEEIKSLQQEIDKVSHSSLPLSLKTLTPLFS
jgi:chromosome segregation ATPase